MDKHTTTYTTFQAYFGSFMAFLAGINWSTVASICGILFGLATILINWYYKQKEYELRKIQIEKDLKDDKNTR